MGFRTKLDYSDNRQIRQTEKTNTILSGSTVFGVPFSGLTSGPDLSTQYQVSQYIGVISEFSGNTSETNFTWSISINVSVVDGSLDVILPSNSGLTQSTSVIFEPSSTTIIDDNLVNLTYSGVQVDNLYVLSMSEVSPNNYTGLVSSDFYIFSADTLDFTGRTIWVDNTEILRTDRIIISRGAQPGYVLTSANSEGMGVWSPISGATGGDSLFETGTTINSTQRKDVGNIADGSFSASLGGCDNVVSGACYSVIAGGISNLVSYKCSAISGGDNNIVSGAISTVAGGRCNSVSSNCSFIGSGLYNTVSGNGSVIGGGRGNSVNSIYSSVVGGRDNISNGACSVIGGGAYNSLSGNDSTISGGRFNTTNDNTTTIGGGFSNCANCFNDTVGGGRLNIACGGNSTVAGGNTNTASGPSSAVGGGALNVGSGWASNVTGGRCNTASGCYTGILGGQCNNTNNLNCAMIVGSNITAISACTTHVNSFAIIDSPVVNDNINSILVRESNGMVRVRPSNTLFCGKDNVSSGSYSAVISGGYNTVSGATFSTVVGGCANYIGSNFSFIGGGGSNTVSFGTCSVIGGGFCNATIGDHTFVGGGCSNSVNSDFSSILGGRNNIILSGNTDVSIIGSNLTGDTSNTTFVNNLKVADDLYIKDLTSTDPLATDADGKIVPGASDYRLKKNIEPIVNGLGVVKKLKGVSYEYTEESNMGGGLKYGFIAQDVKEVIPSVVKPRGKDTDMLMLNYTEIIPWLVEAIKEITSPEFVKENIVFKTETIKAEDNYIELNYNGTYETSIGGGIIISNAKIDDEEDVYFTLNENSFWVTNAYIKPYGLIIPEYSPSSSDDPFGVYGEVTYDNHYLYIKGGDGWLRTELNKF